MIVVRHGVQESHLHTLRLLIRPTRASVDWHRSVYSTPRALSKTESDHCAYEQEFYAHPSSNDREPTLPANTRRVDGILKRGKDGETDKAKR